MSKFLCLLCAALVFAACETTGSGTAAVEQTAQAAQAEYSRSVAAVRVAISEETFRTDKNEVMKVITDLKKIMETKNVIQWRKYLSPTSINYLRNQNNLRALSKRLSTDVPQLRTDTDYFEYVFIPARQGREITEIRYTSPSEVKAVQVLGKTDVIYYYFEKIKGAWLLKIDAAHI